MNTNARFLPTAFGKPMHLAFAGLAMLLALPAQAQDALDDRPSIRDVAMTPLTDLNLNQDEIPPLLVEARNQPYATNGIATCDEILGQVADLDTLLGNDYDIQASSDGGISVTSIAQRVVGAFIPFRGIIRELSGANERQRDFREAIAAGMMRRAYLKGRGEALACPYPASPATPEIIARLAAENDEDGAQETGDRPDAVAVAADQNGFYSAPVVQQVD